MPITIDSSDPPLLRIRYDGAFSDGELHAYLTRLDEVVRTAGKKVALIDLRAAVGAPASQRRAQADWIRSHEHRLKRDVLAAAFVTENALIRGVVTAVFWIRPLPLPTTIVADMNSAKAWIEPYLRTARPG